MDLEDDLLRDKLIDLPFEEKPGYKLDANSIHETAAEHAITEGVGLNLMITYTKLAEFCNHPSESLDALALKIVIALRELGFSPERTKWIVERLRYKTPQYPGNLKTYTFADDIWERFDNVFFLTI